MKSSIAAREIHHLFFDKYRSYFASISIEIEYQTKKIIKPFFVFTKSNGSMRSHKKQH